MSDQYVAEIRIFAGNFAPVGWALCNGQLMPISQNTALFSLLGTNYGGNGTSTFGLPNLQGCIPINAGQGPGLSSYAVGQSGGLAAVTLTSLQLPSHTHSANAALNGGVDTPAGTGWGEARLGKTPLNAYAPTSASNVPMNAAAIATNGGGAAHNNMPPYVVLTFIIALQGIFPPRS